MGNTWRSLGVLSLAVVAFAGCGGDDDSGDGAAAKPASSSGQSFTGKPIKILVSAPVAAAAYASPEVIDNVKAGVDGVNRRGGINGSKIELETCDNANEPNKAAQCAQQAVRGKAVAMVGSYSLVAGSAFYPVLEAAKIPNVGNGPSNPLDWTSAMSFPVGYSTQAYVAAPPVAMAQAGCKRISVVGFEDPAYDPYFDLAAAGIKYAKVELAGNARFSADTKDFAPTIAKVVQQKADCVFTLGPDESVPPIVRALKNSGGDIRLGGLNHVGNNLAGMGKALDGSPIAEPSPDLTLSPPADAPELVKRYAEDMKGAGKTAAKYLTPQGLSQWLAVAEFEQAAKAIPAGKVTSATLIEQLNKLDFNPVGVAGRSNFAEPGALKSAPRVHNYTMYLKVIKDGKREPLPTPSVDLTGLFQQLSAASR